MASSLFDDWCWSNSAFKTRTLSSSLGLHKEIQHGRTSTRICHDLPLFSMHAVSNKYSSIEQHKSSLINSGQLLPPLPPCTHFRVGQSALHEMRRNICSPTLPSSLNIACHV